MGKNVKPRLASATSIYMLVDLDISICRCLHRHGIRTVGALVAAYPYMLNPNASTFKIRGIGKKRLSEIGNVLDFYEVVNTDNDFWRG